MKSGAFEANYTVRITDNNGFFTVDAGSLAPGTYQWRVKGPKYLANSGTVTVSGSTVFIEMGLMKVGDSNNDNRVNISDFIIMKVSFGRTIGDPDYDDRADFTGDQAINVADFNLLKVTFGEGGAPPIMPGR